MSNVELILVEGDNVLTISDKGREAIRNAHHRVELLGQYYGKDSKQHSEAAASLLKNLSMLMYAPFHTMTRVVWDAEMSLFCSRHGQPGGLVFGLIFHEDRRACTVEGCGRYARDDGSTYTYKRYDDPQAPEHEHVWSFPLDAPAAGTWSFHS